MRVRDGVAREGGRLPLARPRCQVRQGRAGCARAGVVGQRFAQPGSQPAVAGSRRPAYQKALAPQASSPSPSPPARGTPAR